MEQHNLYKRLTRKYIDAYRHLDKDVFVGQIKLTPSKKVADRGVDFSIGPSHVQFGRLKSGQKFPEIADAIRDTLGGSKCPGHEYDCCGCASYHVVVEKKGARNIRVITHTSFNY